LALIAFGWRAHRWPPREKPHAHKSEPKAAAGYLDPDQITIAPSIKCVVRSLSIVAR
jgi:hypothetical protein